jgi:hypothetical protein
MSFRFSRRSWLTTVMTALGGWIGRRQAPASLSPNCPPPNPPPAVTAPVAWNDLCLTSTFVYDANGSLLRIEHPTGFCTTYCYDPGPPHPPNYSNPETDHQT